MRLDKVKDIIIYVEGKAFIFSYEQLANIYINIEGETASIRIKPNEYEITEDYEE
jgi:hypothetical protein